MARPRRMQFCETGKFAYLTRAAAEAALEEYKSVPREWQAKGRPPTRFYECPKCGFFHLTSQRKCPV